MSKLNELVTALKLGQELLIFMVSFSVPPTK